MYCEYVKKTIVGHIHRLWSCTTCSWVTSTLHTLRPVAGKKSNQQGQNLTQKIISDTHPIQALMKGRQGFVHTRKRWLWTFTARIDYKTLAPDRVIWRASLEIPAFFMENDPPQVQTCLRTHPILPTPQGNLSSLFHRIDGVCRGLWRSKNWFV